MKLPRVTLDEFLSFKPCWLDDERGRRRLRYYARKLGGSADALEILALRMIPAEDRLCAVLREEFIPTPILHEIACRCAEDVLSRIDIPDPRSINAIVVKRRWIAGEATDEELAAAEADADVAARVAAEAGARAAEADAQAALASWAALAAWVAARAEETAAQAAWDATWVAARAARDASWDAQDAAEAAARNAQVDMLTQMLREYVGAGEEKYQLWDVKYLVEDQEGHLRGQTESRWYGLLGRHTTP